MADLFAQLQAALGDGYRVEKELGGGGMSRVFVATETALERQVVVKVLPVDLAAGLSIERFRREIQFAAKLQHPHIVPLLSTGAAEGLLYYTMPLIEGESLRAKLARQGELPIPEAVRILRDVADALSYAHEHGLVHRDIKPENVLLSGKHALVTDFGVSKALSTATGTSTVTSIGVALGTPVYMAPEQAAADPSTDHRADIYALGVVGYELLTGQPPFGGLSAQQVLAAHAAEVPVAVTQRRGSVPPTLATLVMRCLEKHPADRPQTAGEIAQTLEAIATPSGGTTPTGRPPIAAPPPTDARLRRWALGAGVVLVAGAALYLWWPRQARPVDPNLVAVAPFRVTGADPSLTYLREGMVDLLAADLTGEGGPRAADPRATMSAWRRMAGSTEADLSEGAALRLARGLGAGQLILGGIVGSKTHLVVNARLLTVPDGRTRAQASAKGSSDSLLFFPEQLAAQLLARGAEKNEQRLPSLTTTSLEALRAYLDGQSEYRRGHYVAAAAHLSRALQVDSTFALAAFALEQALGWGEVSGYDVDRVERLAWAARNRLSARDQILLAALIGPNGPVPTSEAEILAARERAVEIAPDDAEAWYFLGDEYFHEGVFLGLLDARERATTAFQRALTLDSTFAAPLAHMVILAAFRGDTTEVRRFGTRYLRADSTGVIGLATRWRMAMALRDPKMLRDVRGRIDSAPGEAWVIGLSLWDEGLDVADGERALVAERRAATTPAERSRYFVGRSTLLFNSGRPAEASAALDTLAQTPFSVWGPSARWMRIGAALYWDGDTAAAAATVRELTPSADGPPARAARERSLQYGNICWVEQWRLAHGVTRTARRALERLESAAAPYDSAPTIASGKVCAVILEAWLASEERSPKADSRMAHADSLMRTGPVGRAGYPFLPFENLVVARLLASRGHTARALAAVRRREYFAETDLGTFLTTYLREEGRLAALTGDREGAARALRRYLAIRTNPEPGLVSEVDRVKAELAALVGEARR
jgi:eukaryotic-like serine/threonine-protein kinase